MNAITLDTDTVLMPVPLRWAPQVAELLAGLRSGAVATGAEAPAAETVTVPGQGKWTRQMLAELADRMPYAGVVALFDRCAGTSGEWVAKSEVEEERGISAIQMRNELGALSKLTKRLFGFEEPRWPMEWKKEQGVYYYRMDATVAQWWTEARGVA